MLLALLGLFCLVLSLMMFYSATQNIRNLLTPTILFLLGAGASIGDPSILAPVGRLLISQVWLGGA